MTAFNRRSYGSSKRIWKVSMRWKFMNFIYGIILIDFLWYSLSHRL